MVNRMLSRVARFLKQLRDTYYVSRALTGIAKPLHLASSKIALQLERKVRRNGVTIPLGNGKSLKIARDAGIWIASELFWHGIDGIESETSHVLRFFFERSQTFVDAGANYGLYSLLGGLWNPHLRI